MGKNGSWISAVKKALSPDSKAKKDKKTHKSKNKWFGKRKSPYPGSPPKETVLAITPIEDVKLTEAENEQNKHAYSVAIATAVAAEAAVAAAQAAAEIVRLTAKARYSGKSKEEVAAIKIQTAFRGYLCKESIAGLERACEVEVSYTRSLCQTTSHDHITMHVDSGSRAVSGSCKADQNVRGEPGSLKTAPAETRERACEI
ncbi:unnamed protein product [Camellia sinensis]